MTTLDPYEHTLADAVRAAQWSLTAPLEDLRRAAEEWYGRVLVGRTMFRRGVCDVWFRCWQWLRAMIKYRVTNP